MTKITDRIKEQPNTQPRVRRYNACIRALMDFHNCSQKAAQALKHSDARRELYELARVF